jgi:GAF domain-containing protein
MKDRETQYRLLLRRMEELQPAERDLTAVLTDTVALLQQLFGFFWTGFYLVQGNELVLGPFLGADACTRIPFGKGVCGIAWKEKRTIVVPDVRQFAGHIACSSESKSEIVVPLFAGEDVIGVLDIDSDRYNAFDDTDALFLEQSVALIHPL